MLRFAVSLLLAAAVLGAGSNPFFTDAEPVKAGSVWTFALKNHHTPPADLSDKWGGAKNPELLRATVTVESLDRRVLHLKMINATGRRWEAPLYNPHKGIDYKPADMAQMGFAYQKDPFTFTVTDPETNLKLLTTGVETGGSLQYFDKLVELGLWYPSARIFGVGERSMPDLELCHSRKNCKYTMFNKDAQNPVDFGIPPGAKQTYGTHAVYMVMLPNGQFMAAFFLNSNGQEVEVTRLDSGAANLYHRTVGGIIDIYFFYPADAQTVMKRYHDLIGRPTMPPFWSLGFHQCRWGWHNIEKMQSVVASYEQADIPLETMWADIDYLQNYTDFTYDPVRFHGLPEFVADLHRKKMRWVPIIDAGLGYNKSNKYISLGEANNAFIRSALYFNQTFVGKVWPGKTAFIDFLSPYGQTLWHMGLSDVEKLGLNFDGIWLDMNEAANFCDGEKCSDADDTFSAPPSPLHDPHEFDDLPYVPGGHSLEENALPMAAFYYSKDAEEERLNKEYNLHDIWGITQTRSTFEYLVSTKRRPFILTRSSFPGSGMFAATWIADNYSTWEYLRYSIISMYNYQLFGMPMSGSDICGFLGHASADLCGRWMQMGAFYPFSRNHNNQDSRDHEPYVFGEKISAASRNAIRQRYSILHYFYTKLYETAMYGGSMFLPLFFEFPNDPQAYLERNDTFLVGASVMVAAALYENSTTVSPYLPNGNWFHLRTRKQLAKFSVGASLGTRITLPAGFDYVNVLLRGGSILPFQDALAARVRRTAALRQLPLEVIVALDHNGNATGTLVVDDGDSLKPIENGIYRYYAFNFSKNAQEMKVELLKDYANHFQFEKFWRLTILGTERSQGFAMACIEGASGLLAEVAGTYDSDRQIYTYQKSAAKFYWSDIKKIRFTSSCAVIEA